jgi:ABC-2 type transport system ATP-binding protein
VRAMQRVHLEPRMDNRVSGYSKGMRQRTKIAQAIAHDPVILIADEPLTGLDPVARRQVIELFNGLAQAGTSILVSSHVLHEVQSMTEDIVLIHRGRLLAQGPVADVRRLISRHPRQVHITARKGRDLASALIAMPTVRGVSVEEDGETLVVDTFEVDAFFDALPDLSARINPGIRRLVSSDAGLEAVFDYLIG